MPYYTQERIIGRGGFGQVVETIDAKGDVFAKKILLHTNDPTCRRRFGDEVAIASALKHKGIVPVLHYNVQSSQPYYIMRRYYEGNLRDRLKEIWNMPYAERKRVALFLVYQIAEALAYAHSQGVIHRDLKPENILIHQGKPLVADFGIAKHVLRRTRLTFGPIGTAGYAAPEQMHHGHLVDYRADIYALGLILRELLTGQTNGEISDKRTKKLIDRMTQPCPSDRYSSMNELLRAIRNLLNPCRAFQ